MTISTPISSATFPSLLAGKRLVVLGSATGLGYAVALAADAAGAEVLGLDDQKRFDGLHALYHADLTDPAALDAAVAALPDGLDGVALLPDPGTSGPSQTLARALLAPRHLARALAPKLAHGGSVVFRGAPVTAHWPTSLAETRAAMALRWSDIDAFVTRWGLLAEPARAIRTAGWGCLGWAMAHAHDNSQHGVRVNTITPATPDGHLPPAIAAHLGVEGSAGAQIAARAVLFLLSDLSAGITGTNLAADGGASAQYTTRLDGL
jgi:NAD(P)-dependent dehydrogenase (short-subunit alcohol dehydrogenase family)